MDELLRKIAEFIFRNIDKIPNWIIDLIEKLVGSPLPSYLTVTKIINYLSDLSYSSLSYIARLLGL